MVIPVRDGERFIDECIRSTLAQTQPVHEVVVVDDGSVDGTADLVAAFGPPVRLVRTAASGVSAARNRGVTESSGDHIAFLDADDAWRPNKVERQLDALAPFRAPLGVHSGYVVTDENLRPVRVVRPARSGPRPVTRALVIEGPGVGFSFTGLVTRSAAERVGGFDERLSTSADLDYAWRLAQSCGLIAMRDALSLHRIHAVPTQMHRDIGRLQHDMEIVLDEAEALGLDHDLARRGRANLTTYAAMRRLGSNPSVGRLSTLVRAAAIRPASTTRMMLAASTQRPFQHLLLRRRYRQ